MTPSLEGWPTKAKEALSPDEVRLAPLDTNPVFQSLGEVTKQVQKNSFISHILSDQVWWCNIKRLLSYFKNCICKFMQANSWHHKLFHFHLSFCICKVWKGREKITKFWISRERKKLFDEIKNTFNSFGRAIIWSKNKNLIKNSGHKLYGYSKGKSALK